MSYETLTLDKGDGLATITLNRPDKLNAICPELITDLLSSIQETGQDEEVRAILLTGAGRAFCAGGDLEELLSQTDNPVELLASSRQGANIISGMKSMPKPWIAAVNGPAIRSPQSTLCSPWEKIASPTGSVLTRSEFVKTNGSRNEFQLMRNVFVATTTSAGLSAGKMIFVNVFMRLAPSMNAASSSAHRASTASVSGLQYPMARPLCRPN